MKKINIASGPINLEGWINVEYGIFPFLELKFGKMLNFIFKLLKIKHFDYLENIKFNKKNVILHNCLKDLDCFENNSVDYFYCSHFIEHLNYQEFCSLLQNMEKKINKKYGIIRLVSPNLDEYISSESTKEINELFYSGYFHAQNLKKLPKIKKLFIKLIYLLFVRPHKYIFNQKELVNIVKNNLKTNHNLEFYKKKEGDCPDIDKLDVHEKSLHLEIKFNE